MAAPGNVGFAAGCRLGAEAARAPTLALVNDDAVVEPDGPRSSGRGAGRRRPRTSSPSPGRLTDRAGRRNDFSDGFLTFDGHAFAADVGRPLDRLPDARPGEERLFACGGLMAVRRERVPLFGRIRRRLLRLPRGRRLRLAPVDLREPDRGRAPRRRAAPRRRHGRGARNLSRADSSTSATRSRPPSRTSTASTSRR